MRSLILMVALVAAGDCQAGPPAHAPSEKELLGNWCARNKPAYHEEFVLDVQAGEHTFNAFLHQRPAEAGSWTLKGDALVIRGGDSAILFNYHVVKHSRSELVLATERGEREYYFRNRCVASGP